MDAQGHLLRVSGDFPLPVPLGSVAQLFVPLLPPKAESKWEFSDEGSVLDEPYGFGPSKSFGLTQSQYGMLQAYTPGSPFGSVSAVVTVFHRTKSELTNATSSTAMFRSTLAVDSPLLLGNEPRISASGEGEWSFDFAGGFLTASEMEYKVLLNSDSSTRRNTIKSKIKLLEGKEREVALASQQERQSIDPATGQAVSRNLSGEDLAKLTDDLKSDDDARKRSAANRIVISKLIDPPPGFVNYMTNYLFDSESPIRAAAAKVVADFGTAQNVPDLLRLLKASDGTVSWSAMRGLGRLKDPRAIQPLIEYVARGGSDSHTAATALENFGPAAEDQVLELLKEKHSDTKRAACGVLRKIGTVKSIEPLKQVMADADTFLSNAASEALRAIQSRN